MRAFCINLCLLAVVVCASALHDGHKHENEQGLHNGGDHEKQLMADGMKVGLHDSNHGRKRRSPQDGGKTDGEIDLPDERKRRSPQNEDKAEGEIDLPDERKRRSPQVPDDYQPTMKEAGEINEDDIAGGDGEVDETEEIVDVNKATRKRRSDHGNNSH